MYIVIAGGGDIGYNLANTLVKEGHNIAIIDAAKEVATSLEGLDAMVVVGNAASERVLDEAYIDLC